MKEKIFFPEQLVIQAHSSCCNLVDNLSQRLQKEMVESNDMASQFLIFNFYF